MFTYVGSYVSTYICVVTNNYISNKDFLHHIFIFNSLPTNIQINALLSSNGYMDDITQIYLSNISIVNCNLHR